MNTMGDYLDFYSKKMLCYKLMFSYKQVLNSACLEN